MIKEIMLTIMSYRFLHLLITTGGCVGHGV